MANPEHLAILQDALTKKDISIWNKWLVEHREKTNYSFRPDLRGARLSSTALKGVDFVHTDLSESELIHADLHAASLGATDLSGARLIGAGLTDAILLRTNLNLSDLRDVNLANARIGYTLFVNVDLSTVKGLESVHHEFPSEISISTIYRSGGNIPESFLRGCGVPDTMIAFAKSLVGKPIEYYSCFISYSSADEHFARRLHNDLQANGVRVWFAPEDLKIGDPIKPTIDESIRLYDKLIIVLSENSINRAWVRHEVTRALDKEKQHKKLVLFPIRLDNSVFNTTEQWAYDIRERHIGDFTKWDNPIVYQDVINRLLRDLKADPTFK